jgi:CRP-like cAMP-binding protein
MTGRPVPFPKLASVSNRLIDTLPHRDRERLTAGCEQVELKFANVLCEPGERIKHVYFPTDSFISLASPVDGRTTLEVGLIGNEGMLGIPAILGIDISAQRALVRGSGAALRMPIARFHRELSNSAALRRALNRYLYALMAQFAQTAACTRFHLLDARLARWLLMTHDRAHADHFHLTHDFLADMLGVRRVGVTKAAGVFQRKKLISYRRGQITILDRGGLRAVSCGCYDSMKQAYDRILR